jgi:hypothetical protein
MFIHKRGFFVFLFFCLCKLLPAQEFKVKAALDEVAASGFYKIPVLPELTAHTKADLSDLRILDHNYQQVPYFIRQSIHNNKDTGRQHFRENPPVIFVQKDSSIGFSYITIHQEAAYVVNRIVLSIDGPKYYKRTAHIQYITGKGVKNYINSFEITSGHLPIVLIGQVKAKSLLIEIENNDNPPLKVRAIKTEQSKKYLVAYLEKGKSYFIMAGNESVTAPQYDLLQFSDSIPNQLTSVSYHYLQPSGLVVQKKKALDMDNWLWPAIIIVILALGFLTYKLLTEMKRSGI